MIPKVALWNQLITVFGAMASKHTFWKASIGRLGNRLVIIFFLKYIKNNK